MRSAAIKDVFDDTRSVAEPAGALAIAGIKEVRGARRNNRPYTDRHPQWGERQFRQAASHCRRAEVGEQREALLAVKIPEKPGSFLAFCRALGKRSITEFNYRYADQRDAMVFCGVELRNGNAERTELVDLLVDGVLTWSISLINETAKLHIRYMVGGMPRTRFDEKLFRFEFPERPGALLDFLAVCRVAGTSVCSITVTMEPRTVACSWACSWTARPCESFEPLCKPPDTCTAKKRTMLPTSCSPGWLTAVGDMA